MATSGYIDSGGYDGRVIRFSWSLSGSTISYSFTAIGGSSNYYYHHNEVFKVNGTTVYEGADSHQVSRDTVLKSGSITATPSLSVQMNGGIYTYSDNIDTSYTWTVDSKATISSAPNFELGNSETVTYSNPTGGSIDISVYGTDGNTPYAAYRTCTGSSYTFNFTDAELDKMYKAMGTGTTLTARVYLRTLATMDLDYKTVTITLKGNQKTIHTKVSGAWKRGKVSVKVNGTWRKAITWVKVNGTWRRGI